MKEGREATGSRGADVGFEHSAVKDGREATGSRGADVGFEHSVVKEGRKRLEAGALTLVLNTPL